MRYGVFYHHIRCAAGEEGCSLDEELKKIRSYGIRYVEIDRDDLGTEENGMRAFSAMLSEHDLTPSSIYGFYDWEKGYVDITGDDLLIRQAEILGCRRIMVIPGFYTDLRDTDLCRDELERMIEGMKKLTGYASDRGLVVTIEDFDNEKSPIGTMDGMERFLDRIPELYVTLDTGNFFFHEEDVLEAYRRFRGRIRHVHLKDRYLPAKEGGLIPEHMAAGDPVKTVRNTVMMPCAVGYGHMPIREILGELKEDGYEGLLSIEHFGVPSYSEAIRDSIQWLEERENM